MNLNPRDHTCVFIRVTCAGLSGVVIFFLYFLGTKPFTGRALVLHRVPTGTNNSPFSSCDLRPTKFTETGLMWTQLDIVPYLTK